MHPLQSLAHGSDGRRQPLQGLVQGLLVKLPDGTNGLKDRLRGERESTKRWRGWDVLWVLAGSPKGWDLGPGSCRARGLHPTLMPGTAAFSTRNVTRMNPLRLSPPGSDMMGSRFLQGRAGRSAAAFPVPSPSPQP